MNEAFETYYQHIFQHRWPLLRESLLTEGPGWAYTTNLIRPYWMDRASVLAAESLVLPTEGEILDACAAPGGKSLVIASRMERGVRLLSNELSRERRRRLVEVLDTHLPATIREQVTVSGFDAAALGARRTEWERFGAILLDVPCSSERHVVKDPAALAQWSPARPKMLSQRQWALLSSAFLLLKPGGCLVYATCALTPQENDEVFRRLIKKYGDRLQLAKPDFPEGEETEFGRHIFPDTSGGMGPMYVARCIKVPD
ncbi:MAG TPA: SAM-dependent methyltransferase [Termitinemataceae bacterium]|nr:SAM-dependent methyltransferase [Termitinemataceae bacterium]HOM24421.1 SAM-dependent methyltransferase [Termitinemataceae bacterium]HPQ01287.1 SAM-dependent methyltransferase [Termitinemataceae bacterium]